MTHFQSPRGALEQLAASQGLGELGQVAAEETDWMVWVELLAERAVRAIEGVEMAAGLLVANAAGTSGLSAEAPVEAAMVLVSWVAAANMVAAMVADVMVVALAAEPMAVVATELVRKVAVKRAAERLEWGTTVAVEREARAREVRSVEAKEAETRVAAVMAAAAKVATSEASRGPAEVMEARVRVVATAVGWVARVAAGVEEARRAAAAGPAVTMVATEEASVARKASPAIVVEPAGLALVSGRLTQWVRSCFGLVHRAPPKPTRALVACPMRLQLRKFLLLTSVQSR